MNKETRLVPIKKTKEDLLATSGSECLKVCVRVRPPLSDEMTKEEVVYVSEDVRH